MITTDNNLNKWTPYLSYGTVLDDYSHSDENVLQLKKGDSVVVIEKIQDWYRGYSGMGSRRKIGIFPSGLVSLNSNAISVPVMDLDLEKLNYFEKQEELLHEIALEIQMVLKDWYHALRELLFKSDYQMFQKLLDLFYELVEKKEILHSDCHTFSQQNQLKKDITRIVEQGNKCISKDEYIRENGVIIKEFGFYKLYKAHCQRFYSRQNIPHLPVKDLGKFQLLIQFEGFLGVDFKDFQVQIGIWNGKSEALYQPFILKSSGSIVFADIHKTEIFKESWFLIIKVSYIDKGVLRPFGNGSVELSKIIRNYNLQDGPALEELSVGISVPSNENDYQKYFESVYQSNSIKNIYAKVSLSWFYGEVADAFDNYPLLLNSASINRKFGNVCYTETKNSLHVNLHSADLSSQKKIWLIKNVQVQVEVRNFLGESLCCIFDGTIGMLHSAIRSVLFSQNDSPAWDMHFRIDLDPQTMLKSHLVISIGNIDEKGEFRPLSFAYLPLFYSQNEPVRDDCHILSLYKFDQSFARPSVYMTVPAGPSIFVPSGLSSLSVEELYNAAEYMAANNIKLKDTVRLSTKLDSSLLTKCSPLMLLLYWESILKNHRGNIFSIIKECYGIDESEVLKFYSQIVSSSLDIIDSDIENINMEQLSMDVVNFLVHIFLTIKRAHSDISGAKLVNLFQTLHISRKLSQRMLRAVQKLLESSTSDSQLTRNQFSEFIKAWDLIFTIIFSPYNPEKDHEAQLISSIIFKKILEMIANQNFRFSFSSQLLIAENVCFLLKVWKPFLSLKRIFDLISDFLKAAKKSVSLQLGLMRNLILDDYLRNPASKDQTLELISNWISLYLTGKWGGCNVLNEYTRVSVKVLAFTTTQKRQELSHLLEFLADFIDIVYSLPKSTNYDKLADCLWILLETFCNYSDWKNMKRSATRQTKVFSAIDVTSSSIHDTDMASLALSDLASIIISFFDMLSDQSIINQFSKYLQIKGIEECAVYVAQWLDAISSFMTTIYPSTWIAMLMSVKQVCLRSLTILSNFMCKEFCTYTGRMTGIKSYSMLNANKVDGYQLWRRCFRSILTLIHIHHSVKSDLFSQNQIILNLSGCDILKRSCDLLEQIWNNLEKNDDYYEILKLLIPKFSAAFLEMALSKESNLQNAGINLLFSMLKLEFRVHGNFSSVEDQIFEQMPWIVEKSKTSTHDEAVISRFSYLFFQSPLHMESEIKFTQQGKKFVEFLDKFLTLATDINNLSQDILNIDEKAYATMKMIQFLTDLEKPEMLIFFIQSLYDLHLSQERYTEAGLLLKQYGDTLPWSSYSEGEAVVAEEGDKPMFRDEIYKKCVDMFEQGQSWERAIEICRVLSEFFQFKLFDFKQLSDILSRQALISEKIRTEDRYFSNYYLVSFFGSGFTNNLNGKVFVYKGLLWEKLVSFCERILKRHPGSKLVKSVPTDLESLESKKVIFIRSVDAYLDLKVVARGSNSLPWPRINEELDLSQQNGPKSPLDFVNSTFEKQILHNMPEYVSSYFESNETSIFTFCRPIRKEISENLRGLGKDIYDFLSNFSQQTVIYTKQRFPGLLSRSEVIKTDSFELSPIENAIITIKKKSRELSKYINQFSGVSTAEESFNSKSFGRNSVESPDKSKKLSIASNSDTNHFTMALNGAVDAPVNGGIPLFRSAFFNDLYSAEAKKMGTDLFIDHLRKAIDDQVIIMHHCLKVHSGIISSEMRPLHDQLITSFNKNFMEEISRINLRPLRQTPESLPLHWIVRDGSETNFSIKSNKFMNQSLLDIRKSGVSSGMGHSHTSVELKRFSDLKRHTALNLLLLESSGCEIEGERHQKPGINIRSSIGLESASEPELVDEKSSSDGSLPKSKGKFAKKILKFITSKSSLK